MAELCFDWWSAAKLADYESKLEASMNKMMVDQSGNAIVIVERYGIEGREEQRLSLKDATDILNAVRKSIAKQRFEPDGLGIGTAGFGGP